MELMGCGSPGCSRTAEYLLRVAGEDGGVALRFYCREHRGAWSEPLQLPPDPFDDLLSFATENEMTVTVTYSSREDNMSISASARGYPHVQTEWFPLLTSAYSDLVRRWEVVRDLGQSDPPDGSWNTPE